MLEHTLSEAERSQILQTIEMFEAITQTQQDDYQSLEILKVAYQQLGKKAEATLTSRRLAEAYFNVGSFSLAMQECEAVLVAEPEAPEMVAMLDEIGKRLQQAGKAAVIPPAANPEPGAPAKDFVVSGDTSDFGLLEIGGRDTDQPRKRISVEDSEQGNEQLGKFLIVQQMFAEDEVNATLEMLAKSNKALSGQKLGSSLLDLLCRADAEKMEQILSALIDRTKFAYVPLEYYDIDRQVVRMLPDELTLNRLFIPFDLISRTIMVAVANPFDAAAREAVQQSLDYNVTWYLAKPVTIKKALQDIYKLGPAA